MPELPEVEFARKSLVRWFEGHALTRAEGDPTRIFRGADRGKFEKLKGALTKADRRGKYLMLGFGEEGVLAHLGMTGKFLRRPAGSDVKWSRARFHLDNGEVIHFQDPRMFGRFEPAHVEQLEKLPAVAQLGIDPLVDGLTVQQLIAAIGDSKQELKVALMDQARITGLGNIHAAEALFRAGLGPKRKPKSLKPDEWKRLHKAIHASLKFALDEQGADDEITYVEEDASTNPFLIYGRAGTPCRKCKTKVKQFTQGGRTTFFCPSCQKGR